MLGYKPLVIFLCALVTYNYLSSHHGHTLPTLPILSPLLLSCSPSVDALKILTCVLHTIGPKVYRLWVISFDLTSGTTTRNSLLSLPGLSKPFKKFTPKLFTCHITKKPKLSPRHLWPNAHPTNPVLSSIDECNSAVP
ncbi:hypothetical protein EDD18DRAFT_1400324 [Armillaria luteobubalina]|uniref:Secreted protein n=1 Tax=Armillaria luteobubalina TaxID=153913 RepID=A0AA39ULM5_9AGAR|nr:hypothetical protein EDD18DRAFT_1400324 [Armillaria luteobubalina]